ncbi:MAG: hypothetical protein JNJ58_11630 [Chitinophagaceae bacterium]|nr:hypothetical protein [Chitinophagaceae bacterium]
MKIRTLLIILILLTICLMACVVASDPIPAPPKENYLEFTLNGQIWKADNGIFGSYHFSEALGPKLIQISGNKGNGSMQQSFNINLFHTADEGEYVINLQNDQKSVAQLANFTPSNYLCGGTFQAHHIKVKIIKVEKNPQHVEATFSGSMQCVEGNQIQITNGKFYYHEN